MAALPPASEINLQDSSLSAYNACLDFEKSAKDDNKNTIRARLLGYLILHTPSESPNVRQEVVEQINSCNRDFAKLSELGKHFVNYFVRPFKKAKGRTPASSDHSSRSSLDIEKMNVMEVIKEAPRDHWEAKEQALIRDGFRCVVTEKIDAKAPRGLYPTEEQLRVGVVFTQCAHIVPESTYFGIPTTDTASSVAKKDYAASVLAVLNRFGLDVEKVNGAKVHSLYNVMTMEHNVHDFFDRLLVWFEQTEVENRYNVKAVDSAYLTSRTITLTSSHPSTLHFPCPKLLALHAICAKVAHLSGAGAYIDEIDRDVEKLGVLAYDGGSFEALTHAILRSSGSIGVRG